MKSNVSPPNSQNKTMYIDCAGKHGTYDWYLDGCWWCPVIQEHKKSSCVSTSSIWPCQVLRSAEDQGSAESLARAQVPTDHDALLANSLIVLRFQGTIAYYEYMIKQQAWTTTGLHDFAFKYGLAQKTLTHTGNGRIDLSKSTFVSKFRGFHGDTSCSWKQA